MARPSLTVRLALAAVLTAACATVSAPVAQPHPVVSSAVTTVQAAGSPTATHSPCPGGSLVRCRDTSWGG